ncbi:hypothetical protein [Dankookia sp. P2]
MFSLVVGAALGMVSVLLPAALAHLTRKELGIIMLAGAVVGIALAVIP